MKRAAKLHGPDFQDDRLSHSRTGDDSGRGANYDIRAYSSPITEQKNVSRPAAGLEPDNVLLTRVLRNLKGKFPVVVAPENPFRFRSTLWSGGRAILQPPLSLDPSLRPDPGRGPNRCGAPRAWRRRDAL